jgi:hypothetical protein
MNELTELEHRLEARTLEDLKPERVYRERWNECLHAFRRLGEIGSSILNECESCGLVVGVAR